MSRRTRVLASLAFGLLLGLGGFLFYAPPATPPLGEIEAHGVEVGGRLRRYLLHVPAAAGRGAPLLLTFHPSQSSGRAMRGIVGHAIEGLAARDRFLVAYPDGFQGHFNDCRRVAGYAARIQKIDDVGFAKAIVDRTSATYDIDPTQVYALGFSNGGHMVLRLALEAPGFLRGGIVVGASMPTAANLDCLVADPPPSRMVFVAGAKDPINPYEGGRVTLFGFGDRGPVMSAEASGEWFARRLGLVSGMRRDLSREIGATVTERNWFGPNGHVRLFTLEEGGHTVPQATYRFPRVFGKTLATDAVLEQAWALVYAKTSTS